MTQKVNPIPEGYHTLTPYIVVDGAARAIEFYKKAFGAELLFKMDGQGGKVSHAELQIGTSRIMLADEHPEMGAKGPNAFGGSPISLMLYVKNVDEMFAASIKNGAKELRAVQDQFYGDRSGMITDPFGHVWTIATHVEDVPPAELAARAAKFKAC